MPELWELFNRQPQTQVPLDLPEWTQRPPTARIQVGGPVMKEGSSAPPVTGGIDPYNPPQVEYVGKPLAQGLASILSQPSWLERATEQSGKDRAAFEAGGVPALMADTSGGQELAGGFGGTTKAVGGALAPPFYSAAQRAVEAAKLGKGTPEQWLGYLRNQPGVKAEEMDWLFGNLPKEGQLTKARMEAHAAENAVQLKEVQRGGSDYAKVDSLEAERRSVRADLNKARELFALDPGSRVAATARVRELADRDQALTDQIVAAHGTPTKFSNYQLPGGENYRETLLTLPQKPLSEGFSIVQKPDGKWALQNPSGQQLTSARTRAELDDVVKSNPGWFPSFRSSHWDEPNVLAHIRMNDREVPGVGKSLHLEEIQSDWHQKGRQKGYLKGDDPHATRGELQRQLSELEQAGDTEGAAEVRAILDGPQMRSGVPDAPFKSTWADLSLKRMIREASEKGHDAISWTPGEAQAARYDLSKQIKELRYTKSGSSGFTPHDEIVGQKNGTLEAFDHNGRKVIDNYMSDAELADHIGKDAAEKLLNAKAERGSRAGMAHSQQTLSGLDLKVGGEGMKAFYDKMLVDKANALGKKHGARVEQSHIEKPPEMDLTQRDASGRPAIKFENQPVHVLRITPQLRDAAMKGFPLFSAGAMLAPGLFGEQRQ